MEFDTLYSVAVNGKIKIWNIKVIKLKNNDGEIIIEYGYINGRKTIARRIITKGKNIGKKNETSPYEQALTEAYSKWSKKKDDGYKTEDDRNTQKSKIILPMLALNYQQRSHDIKFPCYVQAKLDGVRSLFYNNTFYSRKGKEFIFLNHIKKEIQENISSDIILDGELYSDTLSFQELVGLVKKQKPTNDDLEKMKQINWVVYDYISTDDYIKRYTYLKELFKRKKLSYVKLLDTEIANTKEEIKQYLKKYEEQGYEGLIIRNFLGSYKIGGYRSKDLQKLKTFIDDEFKIIDFTEGTGKEKGLVLWICETNEGKTFTVRPEGTHEERAHLFNNGKKYIGELLTVRFQEYTNGNVPRMGVGVAIRGYE